MNLQEINSELRNKTSKQIIEWALSIAKNPVVTTNFRPYESAILFATTECCPEIKVIWCDTGYNTRATYLHATDLTKQLALNIQLYVPKQTTAHRDVVLGIPEVNTEAHDLFTEQVKLEPFRRAMQEHMPDMWFTNLRKGQTAFRDTIDIVSQDKNGLMIQLMRSIGTSESPILIFKNNGQDRMILGLNSIQTNPFFVTYDKTQKKKIHTDFSDGP